MQPNELPIMTGSLRHANATARQILPTHQRTLNRKTSAATLTGILAGGAAAPSTQIGPSTSPTQTRRISYAPGTQPAPANIGAPATLAPPQQTGAMTPVMESVHQVINNDQSFQPAQFTADDFTRAVAVATVSALRHQQGQRRSAAGAEQEEAGHGGHDAPSWSRGVSASVLLGCTALYAIIAGMFAILPN